MEKEDSARKSFGGIIGGVTMRQRVVIPTSLAILASASVLEPRNKTART